MKENIAILLATYNSEPFIREQIDSLLNQTYQDWVLYIRDDCSTDSTPVILKDYEDKYPDKIIVLDNQNKSLKAYLNFIDLLKRVDLKYYMFCDHDDVWLPKKIELSIKRMQEIEKLNSGKPIIVHTDMKVVDQNLNVICNSFWKYSNLLPDCSCFEDIVLCNSANGCTMLFNSKVRDVALLNVDNATMHDILLNQSVTACNGIISAIHEPTVLYRQHFDNVVGATRRNMSFYLKKLRFPLKIIRDNIECWKMANRIRNFPLSNFLIGKIRIFFKKRIVKYDTYE